MIPVAAFFLIEDRQGFDVIEETTHSASELEVETLIKAMDICSKYP